MSTTTLLITYYVHNVIAHSVIKFYFEIRRRSWRSSDCRFTEKMRLDFNCDVRVYVPFIIMSPFKYVYQDLAFDLFRGYVCMTQEFEIIHHYFKYTLQKKNNNQFKNEKKNTYDNYRGNNDFIKINIVRRINRCYRIKKYNYYYYHLST